MIATTAAWGPTCFDRLSQHGWSAILADDGIDALMNLARNPPTALIIDCALSDIDAESVCRKLANDPAHEGMTLMPVVDGQGSQRAARLQQMGLTILDAGKDVPAAVERALAGGTSSPPAAESTAAADHDGPAVARDRPLILLVDDDRDLLRSLTLRLRRYDVDIATSTGGRQAVFKATEVTPDIIVTDYSMPDGNAEYFLNQIRQQPTLRDTPVIVLTGWTFEGRTDAAHQRDMTGRFGAVAYLQKPIDFDRLVVEIQEHCTIRHKAAETCRNDRQVDAV
ncbi:MAG: response regulator [Alphaproteobacteria bacterium]